MPELHDFPLVTTGGRTGRIHRTSRFLDRSEHCRVTLDDGTELTVPSDAVRPQADGSFLLDEQRLNPQEPERAESADYEPAAVIVDEPLYHEEVEVERVLVNRIVDGPVETRQEGDVTIVPVVEEVVTIQKRLLLKEEVRIRRRRTEIREPRKVIMMDGETRIIGADGRAIQL